MVVGLGPHFFVPISLSGEIFGCNVLKVSKMFCESYPIVKGDTWELYVRIVRKRVVI